jgi:hypothetical protein
MQANYLGCKQKLQFLIWFGKLENVDMFKAGNYEIRCRLYAKSKSHRVDGTIVRHPKDAQIKWYSDCYLNHTECNWRCRPKHEAKAKSLVDKVIGGFFGSDDKPKSIQVTPTVYQSASFNLMYTQQSFNINCGIVFELDIDTSKYRGKHYDVVYLDVYLFFNGSGGPVLAQTRRLALAKISTDSFHNFEYHSIIFDGIYYSHLDLLISRSIVNVKAVRASQSTSQEMQSEDSSSTESLDVPLTSHSLINQSSFMLYNDIANVINAITRIQMVLPQTETDSTSNPWIIDAAPFFQLVYKLAGQNVLDDLANDSRQLHVFIQNSSSIVSILKNVLSNIDVFSCKAVK